MRLALVTLCFLAVAAAAAAQEPPAPPSPLAEVYRCADMSGDTERLACYDAAAGRLREAESSGALIAVDAARAQTIRREAFGFSLPALPSLANVFASAPREEGDSEMAMEIARIHVRADRKASYIMTNGQTWTQTVLQPRSRARVGSQVTIREGAMGGYMMSLEAGPAERVRREQ